MVVSWQEILGNKVVDARKKLAPLKMPPSQVRRRPPSGRVPFRRFGDRQPPNLSGWNVPYRWDRQQPPAQPPAQPPNILQGLSVPKRYPQPDRQYNQLPDLFPTPFKGREDYSDFGVSGPVTSTRMAYGAPKQPKPIASVQAGVGDLLSVVSGASGMLGFKEQRQIMMKEAKKWQSLAPKDTLGEFDAGDLLKPDFWTTKVPRTLPIMASLIPLAMGGYVAGAGVGAALGLGAFGTMVVGSLAGTLASRPIESLMEAGGTYNDALAQGMPESEAKKASQSTFIKNLAVGGFDIAELALSFAPTPFRLGNKFVKYATISGKVVAVGLQEGVEEAIQDVIQRQSLGQEVKIDPQMWEAATLGFIMGAGMGGAGGLMTSVQEGIQQSMPPNLKQKFDADKAQAIKEGLTEEKANEAALNKLAETPEGKTLIERIIAQVKEIHAGERGAIGKEGELPKVPPIVPRAAPTSPYAKPPGAHEVPQFGEEGAIPPPTPPAVSKAGRRRVIEARLKRGEPVPDKLLAEFPDLAKAAPAPEVGKPADISSRIPFYEYLIADFEKTHQKELSSKRDNAIKRQYLEYKQGLVDLEKERIPQQAGMPEGVIYKSPMGRNLPAELNDVKSVATGFEVNTDGTIDFVERSASQAKQIVSAIEGAGYQAQILSKSKTVGLRGVADGTTRTMGIIRAVKSTAPAVTPTAITEPLPEAVQPQIKPVAEEVAPEQQVAQPEAPKEVEPVETEVSRQLGELTKMYDFWRNKVKTLEETKVSLAKYVRENLPTSVRGKFITSVARVKTDAQLEIQMAKVRRLAEQTESKRLQIEINKELKKAVPIKKAGIIKGRLGGEAQAEINAVKQSLALSKDSAMTKIASNMQAYEKGLLAYEDMVEQNTLLGMAGIKEMTVQELADTLDYIKSIKEVGRAGRLEQLEKFKKQMETDRDSVKKVLTGGRPINKNVVKEFNTATGWFQKLINGQLALTDFMDKLSVYDKASKQYGSGLSKFVDNRVTDSRNAENEGLQSQQDKIQKAFSDIFGTGKASKANDILRQLGRDKNDLGTFKDLDGEEIHLVLTKGQMLDVYNLMKAPENLPTFVDGNRYSQKMMDTITNRLTVKEKAWADWMRTYLASYWESINAVYEPLYGVNLGRHENYWPRNRDVERGDISEQILLKQDFDHFASVNNGSLKARTDNKIPFEFLDANTKLLNHIQQMEHFKAWALSIRDMRSLFMNKDIRIAIRQYHGSPIMRKVDEFINDLARGGIEKAKVISGLDKIRGHVTVAQLGLKPGPALKQPASLLAYATEMPTMDFITGITDYLKNPIRNYRTLRDLSPGLRARYRAGNWERDVKTAVAGGAPKSFSGKMGFNDYMLWLLRTGDKYSQTVPGMWAKYKSELKAMGVTQGAATTEQTAKAIRSAEQSTNRTQVASYIETLSTIQRGGSLARLATMFQDQPAKYFRLINANFRNMWAGRTSKKKAISSIFILWVLAPALFQLMADGFKWRKERQLRAWLLGPVNDLLIFGQASQTVFGWMQGEQYPYTVSPVLDIFNDIQRAISKARKLYSQGVDPLQDISVEDVIGMLESLVQGAGLATGLPTPYIVQAEKAVRRREPKQLIWSEWALRKPAQEYFPKEDFEEYNKIPSNPDELKAALRDGVVKHDRSEYRERYPEIDAKLFISGQVSTIKTPRASSEVLRLVEETKIKPTEISAVSAWQEAEQKREELGLRDTNITLTDKLIVQLLKMTPSTPGPSQPSQTERQPFKRFGQ